MARGNFKSNFGQSAWQRAICSGVQEERLWLQIWR